VNAAETRDAIRAGSTAVPVADLTVGGRSANTSDLVVFALRSLVQEPEIKKYGFSRIFSWTVTGSNRRLPACKVATGEHHCAPLCVKARKFGASTPGRRRYLITVRRKCLFLALTLERPTAVRVSHRRPRCLEYGA